MKRHRRSTIDDNQSGKKGSSGGQHGIPRVIYKRIVVQKSLLTRVSMPYLDTSPASCITNSLIDLKDYVNFGELNHGQRDKPSPPPATAAAAASLIYPNGFTEDFLLLSSKDPDEYAPVQDIVESIKIICEYSIPAQLSSQLFGTQRQGPLRQVIKAFNKKLPLDLLQAVCDFNAILKEHWVDAKISCCMVQMDDDEFPNALDFVTHVFEQSYSRSVSPFVDSLIVKGFSNNVYGEIKPRLVDEFIKELGLKPGMVFLDVGSGIGNVVLQVAAQCLCESYGIEIQAPASKLAQDLAREFLNRMKCYCRSCGKIELVHGDFLDNTIIDDVLRRADVVFVNNFIFDAALNQKILHKFLDLKDTCKILSLKSFIPLDRKITGRTSHSINNILTGQEYFYGRDSVSWTSEGGSYYIQTIDRANLRMFDSI